MESRESLLATVDRLLSAPVFSHESKAKCDALLALADARDPHRQELRRARLTQLEMDGGERTERTLATDTAHQGFVMALRHGVQVLPQQTRALSVGSDPGGGYVAPHVWAKSLYKHMAAYDAIFDENVITLETTATGASFSQPILHDENSTSYEIAENDAYTEANDLVFDTLALGKAKTFRTDMVRCSNALIQDSAYPIDQMLAQALGLRLARGVGRYCVGVLKAAAVVGKQGASGQTDSVVYEDLIDLLAAINPAYLSSPKAAWMMNFKTLQAIQKLKDSSGRPMKEVQRTAAGAWEVLGFPVRICPSFDDLGAGSPATGHLPIAVGDFGAFHIRVVADGVRVLVKRERFAEYDESAFLGFWRGNAGLAVASGASCPVQFYKNAVS